ncbi:hypothetical protein HELRODRAFT_69259, partial [Helobdella robusta]|uniref:SH3 domain-containing protein n=1 Tax=Helobdella robusta TaxID=6412 RepID=T1FZR9_HELRO
RKVIALYDFQSEHQGDLNFRAGEVINVLKEVDDDWLLGNIHNQTGIFPKNFVF